MQRPTKGFLAHGGSENHNKGPIRCAVLDLETGEVVIDEGYNKKHREGMQYGSCQDAATISILSAVIWAHRNNRTPLIYTTDPTALDRAKKYILWAKTGQPPYWQFEENQQYMHPLITQAFDTIDFNVSDVILAKWDKALYGPSPLAYGLLSQIRYQK